MAEMILDDAKASWNDGNETILPQDGALDVIITTHAQRLAGMVGHNVARHDLVAIPAIEF